MNIEKVIFWISLLALTLILSWCGNTCYDINKECTMKAVVLRKSIDTLTYRCGYKGHQRCRGVFNRVFMRCSYGDFVREVCECEYDSTKVGEIRTYTMSKFKWNFIYDIKIPY